MINNNLVVFFDLIDKSDILFCGTPDEYLDILKNN